MKKAVTLILSMLILATMIFSLVSCGEDDGIPSGMQIVAGGEKLGYYFYAPEEWTTSNLAEIKSAYAYKQDKTSVSFAEIYPASPTGADTEEYFFTYYFADSLAEFPEGSKPEVTKNGETTVFGKEGESADRAVKYIYNYEYNEQKFGFMQILMKKSDKYYIFTYASLLEKKTDDKTYYEYYEDSLLDIIENFRFVKAEDTAQTEKEPVYDADGFVLISDKKLAGFKMYVPADFVCDYSSAIVSATHSDGSNVNLSQATSVGGGTTFDAYFKARVEGLSAIVTNLTVIRENESTEFGNADAGFLYEYTFEYNGEKYHTLQLYGKEGSVFSAKGYVLTYTAKEANYVTHLLEVEEIIEKVDFK